MSSQAAIEPEPPAEEVAPTPEPELTKAELRSQYERHRSRRKHGVAAHTVSIKRAPKHELAMGRALYPDDGHELPKTRAECRGGPRPGPLVSCQHNLYLDVSPKTGAIKLNFPDLEPEDMKQSCALDVAERGGATLEEVGEYMNVTRERIRQYEVNLAPKMRRFLAQWKDHVPVGVPTEIMPPSLPIVRRDPKPENAPRARPILTLVPTEAPTKETPMPRCKESGCDRIVRLGKMKEAPPPGTEELCARHRKAFLKGEEPFAPARKKSPGAKPKARRAAGSSVDRDLTDTSKITLDELLEAHRLVAIVGMDVLRGLAEKIEGASR